MAKNWLTKLQKLDGAVLDDYDPHQHVARFPSPSVNVTFGKGHGIPFGYTLAVGGPPKGGKTLMSLALTGQLHADDPEAVVIAFNTEFRAKVQSTPESRQRVWGIDRERYLPYEVNSPMDIFDRIEKNIAAECQQGMPLKLVIIDSIDGIQGRRSMNADTIETQQIGDWALTLGEGFKRILPIQRKYGFAVYLVCQIRTEMDKVEIMRGNKFKLKLPLAVQHYAEYFMYAEPNLTKDAKADLNGNEFKNEERVDLNDKADQTGHKIRVKMKDNSCGPKGRTGEFTLDYERGIINTHEEVFLLGTGRGIIDRPNNTTYEFGGNSFRGKAAMLEAIMQSPEMREEILTEVKRRDNEGAFAAQDKLDEQRLDE